MRWLRDRAAESVGAFRDVFRNPGLRRVQLGYIGSEFARWEAYVALAVPVFQSGGATAVGLLFLVRTLPSALAAPFASILGDRRNRASVMLAADLVRVAAMAILAIVAFTDASIVFYFVLAAVVEIVSTAFRPAQAALLPTLATTPQELTAANVVASTIESVASFAGPALGGAIVAIADPGVAFIVGGASFAWSALMVALLRKSGQAEEPQRAPETVLQMATAGFRTTVVEPKVRLIVGLFSMQTLIYGALSVLLVVLALDILDSGPAGLGLLDAVMGAGGLVGALVAISLIGRGRLAGAFGGSLIAWGVPVALLGAWGSQAGALLLLAVVGIANTLVDVAGFTLLQRAVPDDVLARVFGVLESLFLATAACGAMLASGLLSATSFETVVAVVGCLLPALAILSMPRLRAIDADTIAPLENIALLRQISFFALLPPTSLERLASNLIPLTVPSGTDVVVEGEPGDRFYVIASGEVVVATQGSVLAELGPGSFFGEIALLRDVPRTATVTATTELELLALERDIFIGAVTGHAPTADAVGALVSARLENLVRPAARMI
jgi:MFS family permease